MAILVGSDVPGLLSALENRLEGSQKLTVVRDAESIASLISNPSYRLDGLILSDTIAPHPGKDIATSLWEIAAYISRYRDPAAPIILTLNKDTPVVIQDALRSEVRKTGGDLQLISSRARNHRQPEARQVVDWIIAQLKIEPHRRQYSIVSTSNAGGSGKTSTVVNFCLQLTRLGLRVLVVDMDIAQSALLSWFRPQDDIYEFFTTIPSEYPEIDTTYPLELVERRIYHHATGLDLLFSGQGIRDQLDISTEHLEQLIDTIAQLDYDVVCYDMPGEWKTRPVIVSLLANRTSSPFVICPPGRKEREGALAALEVLGKIDRDNGRTALDAAMLLFIEGERGQLMDIRNVRKDTLQQYPMVTDLGTIPRDPALLSMVAERREFCSVFDLAPRRPYCHALRAAVRRWFEAVELPATWVTRPDPFERRLRQPFWRRWSRQASTPPPVRPVPERSPQEITP